MKAVAATSGDPQERVVMLEEKMELERMLEERDAKIRQQQSNLEEELRMRLQLSEENEALKKAVGDRNGATRPSSSGGRGGEALAGGSAATVARLNRQLEEADKAKAMAEEEAEGLRAALSSKERELKETNERLAKSLQERVALTLRLEGQKDVHSEVVDRRREVESLQQKLHDLQRSIMTVKQERDHLENQVHEKVQQQRAEQRKHQAALLEKSNELGALRRQLADRPTTNGRLLKMTIDMMCMRHAQGKLEEELKSKAQEIESLKAGSAATGTPSTESRQPDASQGEGKGRASEPSSETSRSTEHPPSLDELNSVYGEHMKSLEVELAKLREELVAKQNELGEKGRECESMEQQKSVLLEELDALRQEQEEAQHQLRKLELLRATASAERRTESSNAQALASNMEDQILALEMELGVKNKMVESLKYEVFDLKKRLKMSTDQRVDQRAVANATHMQQRVEALQDALEKVERDQQQLEMENSQMQQALLMAQREREEMEQILKDTEKGLDKYYEDAERQIKQYWKEAQQFKEDLKRATDQSDSLRRQLLDCQKTTQLQVSKMHKGKKKIQEEHAEKVAMLERAAAELQEQLEEKHRAEGELRAKMQRQGSEVVGSRGQSAVLEGLRNDVLKLRAELQRAQGVVEEERTGRVQAEEAAERSFAQIKILQERASTSFTKERDSLVREMEAHQETRRFLEQEKEETVRQKRRVRELEEYKDTIINIAVPDRRRPGHRLQLRPKGQGTFNCRSCKGVKHGFMWKCQDRNCQDTFCTECLANGHAG